jgi:glycosyltransferase involved in cell wall biosynthesis
MRPDERSPSSVFSRVAVVHEWLTHPGGSEKVVLELLRMLPEAEVFTSVHDRERWAAELQGRTVHASFLDRVPGARTHYPKLLALMNAAFESFDLSPYDLVVSSSHSCAKNVLTGPDTLHVCYCHTPMRHAWEPRFVDAEGLGPAGRAAAGLLMRRMRHLDARGASRPDVYVANSTHVAARIAKYYRRDARVIHPPVEMEALLERPRAPEDYYLVLGRAVGYKRVDLAVAACAMLGRRVKVAGTGRGLEAARAVAGPGAEFLGRVEDERIGPLLSGARALLFPGEEDFGIVPVEAQAAGVPVVAYGTGGVRDSVIEGETGVFCAEQTVASFASAILELEDSRFDEDAIRANARRFSPARFRAEMADVLLEHRSLTESA